MERVKIRYGNNDRSWSFGFISWIDHWFLRRKMVYEEVL